MAEKTLIIAKSGSGKSASLRNVDPEKAVCVQVISKRLPFPDGKNWKLWEKATEEKPANGSRIVISDPKIISKFIVKAVEAGKKIIIIDDLVYSMANKVMDEVENKDWDKWTYLAKEIYDLFKSIDDLPEDVRVYFLTHTEEDANGNIKMKTAGKLLDNLITPEGMFTIVLGAALKDEKYVFKTKKEHVSEPYKTPMGMFENTYIENDLKVVDQTICDYYGIKA